MCALHLLLPAVLPSPALCGRGVANRGSAVTRRVAASTDVFALRVLRLVRAALRIATPRIAATAGLDVATLLQGPGE